MGSLQLRRISPINHGATARIFAGGGEVSFCNKQSKLTCALQDTNEMSTLPEILRRRHIHVVAPNQCCSLMVQEIDAPIEAVWSVVRRFDRPQLYKHFIRSCRVIAGDGGVGSLRELQVVSGLPAVSSTERLEILDDEKRVMSFSVVGGEHRLRNYRSVTTLHERSAERGGGTVVAESYLVDIPQGNTEEETCAFVDTIVRCNLMSLAQVAPNLEPNM